MHPNGIGEYVRHHIFQITVLLAGALVSLAIAATGLPSMWSIDDSATDIIGHLIGGAPTGKGRAD